MTQKQRRNYLKCIVWQEEKKTIINVKWAYRLKDEVVVGLRLLSPFSEKHR